MKTRKAVEQFLTAKRIAVTGVSRTPPQQKGAPADALMRAHGSPRVCDVNPKFLAGPLCR